MEQHWSVAAVILLMLTSLLASLEERHQLCGSLYPLPYNPKTHDCKNGMIRAITTRTTKRPRVTTVKPKRPNRHNPTPKPSPDPEADILNCTFSRQYGKTKGQQCCGGFKTYNARFDTCCQNGLKAAVTHRNKKERKHACCADDPNVVYERGSRAMPCKHPSLNDKLFRGQHKLKVLSKNCKDYMEYNFAYLIRIHKKTKLHFTDYNATITQMSWISHAVNVTSFNKLIPIDKYSPMVRRIHRKAFVVLSNYDQSQNLDFYLDRSPDKEDVVFKKSRVTKKFPKRFNKLCTKCRKKISRSKALL